MNTDADRPLLMSVPKAAEMLGIAPSTLYGLLRAGELRSVVVGESRRMIAVAELHRYIDERTVVGL